MRKTLSFFFFNYQERKEILPCGYPRSRTMIITTCMSCVKWQRGKPKILHNNFSFTLLWLHIIPHYWRQMFPCLWCVIWIVVDVSFRRKTISTSPTGLLKVLFHCTWQGYMNNLSNFFQVQTKQNATVANTILSLDFPKVKAMNHSSPFLEVDTGHKIVWITFSRPWTGYL